GKARDIGLGLLDGDPPEPGDWIMVHMGFALERMTEAEARDGLEVLTALGQGFDDGEFGNGSVDAQAEADDDWAQAMAADEAAALPARGG
ncbi:MAG: HypC/HybG/HupF family hydrogenase formation chaperone, partial [Solirubrobacterales bacterium]|nr:HypC/HybG/HupF family hydrogenase formation chaperone [Solirubrobacterales bacterium]